MSLLIKGMKMPKKCAYCQIEQEVTYADETGFIYIGAHRCPLVYPSYTDKSRDEGLLPNCPIVSVPPHGRLIDADAVFKQLQKQAMSVWGNDNPRYQIVLEVMDAIRFAPTIIPAEEGET